MSHKKAGGSTRNGRDSNAQNLGVKRFGGQAVLAGTIIVLGEMGIRHGASMKRGTANSIVVMIRVSCNC